MRVPTNKAGKEAHWEAPCDRKGVAVPGVAEIEMRTVPNQKAGEEAPWKATRDRVEAGARAGAGAETGSGAC